MKISLENVEIIDLEFLIFSLMARGLLNKVPAVTFVMINVVVVQLIICRPLSSLSLSARIEYRFLPVQRQRGEIFSGERLVVVINTPEFCSTTSSPLVAL